MEDAVAKNAGIVDDGIDAPKIVDSRLNDCLGACGVGNGIEVCYCLSASLADRLDHFLGWLLTGSAFTVDATSEIVDDDLGTFPGAEDCHLTADAATRARDKEHLAVHATHIPFLHLKDAERGKLARG
jgi:hypothetical protein